MSFERLSQVKDLKGGEGLDVFLDGMMLMYDRQVIARNNSDELRFNTAVLEENLSLEDQLDYRTAQLDRVGDSPDEKKRVRLEMAGLKDRIEQKKFSDKYIDQLIQFESGVSSIDNVITWLETEKANATDITIKDKINTELVARKGQKFTITQNILKNQTSFALTDKSESVLNEQISRLNTERSKAILSGNNEVITNLDLQIQVLYL